MLPLSKPLDRDFWCSENIDFSEIFTYFWKYFRGGHIQKTIFSKQQKSPSTVFPRLQRLCVIYERAEIFNFCKMFNKTSNTTPTFHKIDLREISPTCIHWMSNCRPSQSKNLPGFIIHFCCILAVADVQEVDFHKIEESSDIGIEEILKLFFYYLLLFECILAMRPKSFGFFL
jgi:hypothetical protein